MASICNSRHDWHNAELPEVLVEGECPLNFEALNDDKAYAISEAPLLVRIDPINLPGSEHVLRGDSFESCDSFSEDLFGDDFASFEVAADLQ